MPLSRENQKRVIVGAVLLDLLAVSLVVPLLPARFRELGVSSKALGLVGSTYSVAQIVGGLALGALSDGALGRKGLLLLNFVGAGSAYAMVGWPSAPSRSPARSALWIGRVSSAAQVSWIAGQSLGGYLNSFGDARYPSAVAVGLYAFDFALISLALPAGAAAAAEPRDAKAPAESLVARLRRTVLASRDVAAVCVARLALAFAGRAAAVTRQLYELERWDLTRGDAAYLGTFKSFVGVLSSWHLAGALTRRFGAPALVRAAAAAFLVAALAEAAPAAFWRRSPAMSAAAAAAAALRVDAVPVVAKALADPSLLAYALAIFPLSAAASQVSTISLRAMFTEAVPRSDVAAALASLDVLMSSVGVAAPLLGGIAFDGVAPGDQPRVAAGFHLAALGAVLVCFPPFRAAAPAAPREDESKKDA
ncbi:major facilitator superfamily-like protein [Aureococcus anophagefferens]|nr:major facilitator superfamily-like protein [Aureococcus anophagefferens]